MDREDWDDERRREEQEEHDRYCGENGTCDQSRCSNPLCVLAAVFPYALSRAEDMEEAAQECARGGCVCATQPLDETCRGYADKAAAVVERARIALGLP